MQVQVTPEQCGLWRVGAIGAGQPCGKREQQPANETAYRDAAKTHHSNLGLTLPAACPFGATFDTFGASTFYFGSISVTLVIFNSRGFVRRMPSTLRNVRLDDKYELASGTLYTSGAQALARLPMLQHELDQAAGLNTAGFISGYRGSPLGHLDMTLWRVKDQLAAHNVVFQPGINEDLAATAVAGTQQLSLLPETNYDGVYAMWYGKGPGVDRSMDAFKHGNFAGAHPNGGVLLVYGDDHPGKSSTVSHQSEQALAAQLIPSLYPASAREFFRFGLLGWAMSRYSGAWVGLKTVNESVEQTATCTLRPEQFAFETPPLDDKQVHNVGSLANRLENERIALEDRLSRVQAFVRANRVDEVALDAGERRFGIVTSGKSYMDVRQALDLLCVRDDEVERYGLSVYKVGCIWPLEPQGARAFANGLDELLVVEEKKPFLEQQLATLLINDTSRPALSGKLAADGTHLFSSVAPLQPRDIALALVARLEALGLADAELLARADTLRSRATGLAVAGQARTPFFCSGCPHNRSTRIPEGSHAMVGTGCATMEVFFRPERIVPAQMGGEGANWIGLAPFTKSPHIFQNMGDGTFFHSGLMSIRAAVASGVNITFKILYNDAVAMTGGQQVDGPLSPEDMAAQLLAEGVRRCVVVAEDPQRYRRTARLPAGVDVFHRDELDRVQREMRELEGCTVIIYEQTCAAEKRRRRKRGQMDDPDQRMFIYDPVCEGCGDCSRQSNCVSVQPLDTAFGTKRRIDQFSCNKDYSCNHGFCPSFITVRGGRPKKGESLLDDVALDDIPVPAVAVADDRSFNVMVAGIGGTGVVTVAAVLGMAAHLERRACSVFDMTGLAQKNGAVYSHLKVADNETDILTAAVADSAADLVLGFDLVAATSAESYRTIDPALTRFVGDSGVAPLPTFQVNPDAIVDEPALLAKIVADIGADRVHTIDARQLASKICGDSIMSNFLLLGFAAQLGALPVSVAALKRAIELNGVAVASNVAALDVGRLAAHDPAAIERLIAAVPQSGTQLPATLDEIIDHRAAHLADYQDRDYANRYRQAVTAIAAAESRLAPGQTALQEAVAINYAKLLAYKDEYEIARLYSSDDFVERVQAEFDGDYRLAFNFAPPLLARPDPLTGRPRKTEFGPWVRPVLRVLASLRGLRGGAADIFGYTAERRLERQLIADYEAWMRAVIDHTTPERYGLAIELLQLPDAIRGFGPLKIDSAKAAQLEAQRLRGALLA